MGFRINGVPLKNRQAEDLLQHLQAIPPIRAVMGYDSDLSEREFAGVLNLNYPFERRFNSQDIVDFNTKTQLSVDDYFTLMQEYRRQFPEATRSVRTPAAFEARFIKWEQVIFTQQKLKSISNQELIAIVSYFWPKGQSTKLFPKPYAKCEKGLCQQIPGVVLPEWFVELYVNAEKPMRERNITNFLAAILTARYGSFTREDLALFLDIVAVNTRAYGSAAFLDRMPILKTKREQVLAGMSDQELLVATIDAAYAENSELITPPQNPDEDPVKPLSSIARLIQLTSPVRNDRSETKQLLATELERRENAMKEVWSHQAIESMIDALEKYHAVEAVYHSIDIKSTPTPLLVDQFREAVRKRHPDIDKVEKTPQ